MYCDFTNHGTFVGGLSNEQVNIYGTPSNLFSGNDVFNNLSIASGASLEINDDLFIRKNFTNNGSFDHNHHEISFIGNIPQQITSGTGTFGDITINNTAGTSNDILLMDDLTITDHLTLSNGIINTNSNSIIFTSSAGTATGNPSSFVNGRVTRSGITPFVFPTGHVTSRDLDGDAINEDYVIWAPIGIEPSANATVSVEYAFDNTSMPDWWEHGGNMDATLHHVSDREYWIVDSDQELTTVTLYWNDNAHALGDICPHGFDNGNPADFVPTDMSVAYWSGTMWTDVDYNSGSSVINHDQGHLTSRFAVPFGTKAPKYITFGSKNNLNPLPVDLISFDAECQDYQIEFNWATASETNNDYFVIEMSKDMINFEQVVKIQGAGNSNSINQYQELIETKKDYNYFRLVQVDFDGKATIYHPIVVNCDSEQEIEPELIVYPNPFNNDFYVELNNFNEKNATIQIIDELGKIIYQESISELNMNNVFYLNPTNLKPSMYQLRVVSDENIINQKIIKK